MVDDDQILRHAKAVFERDVLAQALIMARAAHGTDSSSLAVLTREVVERALEVTGYYESISASRPGTKLTILRAVKLLFLWAPLPPAISIEQYAALRQILQKTNTTL